MLSEQRVKQALRSGFAGEGAVYMPRVTTYQRERNEALRRQVEAQGFDGATVFFWDAFFIWYRADDNIQPDAVPAPDNWVERIQGAAGHAIADGIFSIVDNTDAEYVYYTFSPAAPVVLSNAQGTVLECRVRVTGASAGANTGAAIAIYDDVRQFVLWLRNDGINIDGQPDAPIDMSTAFRRVRLVVQGAGSQVFVDGELRQAGGFTNWSGKNKVLFGSYVDEP